MIEGMQACSAIKCALTLLPWVIALGCAPAAAPQKIETDPLALLREAAASDRINSGLYSRSAPGLDHYYALKAQEVEDVIRRLQSGEKVPQDDIDHALDNSLASTFGVPVY